MRIGLASMAGMTALAVGTAALAGPRARMVEAFAGEGFDRTAAVWILPTTARQGADPVFKIMSAKLAETLTENGFTLAPTAAAKSIVTIDYAAGSSGLGMNRGSTNNDPSYRVVIVTGYDASDPTKPKLTWQTVMDEYGISNNVKATIPGLISAGGRYFGLNKTAHSTMAASWCASGSPVVNSHIRINCAANPDKPSVNRAGYVTSGFIGAPENAPGPGGPPG